MFWLPVDMPEAPDAELPLAALPLAELPVPVVLPPAVVPGAPLAEPEPLGEAMSEPVTST